MYTYVILLRYISYYKNYMNLCKLKHVYIYNTNKQNIKILILNIFRGIFISYWIYQFFTYINIIFNKYNQIIHITHIWAYFRNLAQIWTQLAPGLYWFGFRWWIIMPKIYSYWANVIYGRNLLVIFFLIVIVLLIEHAEREEHEISRHDCVEKWRQQQKPTADLQG